MNKLLKTACGFLGIFLSCNTYGLSETTFNTKMEEIKTKLGTEFGNLQTYLEAQRLNHVTAEAELIFMDSATPNASISGVGNSIYLKQNTIDLTAAGAENNFLLNVLYHKRNNSALDPYISLISDREKFCDFDSDFEKRIFNCKEKIKITNDSPEKIKTPSDYHADIRIGNILDRKNLSGDNLEVAKMVANNIVNPIPDPALLQKLEDFRKGKLTYDEKKVLAEMLAPQAAIGVANYSLASIIRQREGTDLAPSVYSSIATENTRRFLSTEWHNKIAESSNEALLRELVQMEAYRLFIEQQKYASNERMEVLLASLISQIASLGNKLNSSLTAAAKPNI